MNNLDKQYQSLLQDILDNGIKKEDRTGTGTLSVFGRQIRHKMSEGFPLLTTKKMYFKGIVTELLWFLRGDTNIKYLVDNDCHIWDGDAYKNYVKTSKPTLDGKYLSQPEFIHWIKTNDEFAKKWGDLGFVYGKQWRNWGISQKVEEKMPDGRYRFVDKVINPIDQIANLIEQLKTNPDSRRLMVSAWNVAELDQMTLPPCHYGFQVYTRELSNEEKWEQYTKSGLNIEINGTPLELKHMGTSFYPKSLPKRAISLMWNQRSVDTFLGLPFNIASYGLLLEIIAKEVNMVPDELIGNLGDTHLYLNHIEQAKEQIGRELTFQERVDLANNNDVNISNKMGDYNFVEIQLDNLGIPKSTREPYPLPKLGEIPDYLCMKDNWECYEPSDFTLENYQSHPSIKAPLSN